MAGGDIRMACHLLFRSTLWGQPHNGIFRIQHLSVLGAWLKLWHWPPFGIRQNDVRLARLEEEFLAPLPERYEQWKQRPPLRRQDIFLIGASIGCWHGLHDAVRQKMTQAGRQNVLGQPEAPLKLSKSTHAVERVSHDQQRPPVAYRIQRPRYAT